MTVRNISDHPDYVMHEPPYPRHQMTFEDRVTNIQQTSIYIFDLIHKAQATMLHLIEERPSDALQLELHQREVLHHLYQALFRIQYVRSHADEMCREINEINKIFDDCKKSKNPVSLKDD